MSIPFLSYILLSSNDILYESSFKSLSSCVDIKILPDAPEPTGLIEYPPLDTAMIVLTIILSVNLIFSSFLVA